jgi:hypothetical protein
MLIRRGVRRVFAIYVKERAGGVVEAGPVKEWLGGEGRWLDLEPEAEIGEEIDGLRDALRARRRWPE